MCCPSNPVVSIGPILAVPGIRDRARRPAATGWSAVSPIVAGAAIEGPADRLLRELGHEPSALGVARLYAPWVGTFVIDEADGGLVPADRGARGPLRRRRRPSCPTAPVRHALAKVVLDAP